MKFYVDYYVYFPVDLFRNAAHTTIIPSSTISYITKRRRMYAEKTSLNRTKSQTFLVVKDDTCQTTVLYVGRPLHEQEIEFLLITDGLYWDELADDEEYVEGAA